MERKLELKTYRSEEEKQQEKTVLELFHQCPIPNDQILSNLGLFLHPRDLSRLLFMDHLFKQIIDVPGIIIDFGTRWGLNMALFSALRGIYDPFNRGRKIVGFDTFCGFPHISKEDGTSDSVKIGNVSVPEDYIKYLTALLDWHEENNPLAHIKKYEICVGDASIEIKKYLGRNPETIVALVYFDINLYEPTKNCLKAIQPNLTKGSVLAFDELNDHDMPGETMALRAVFNLSDIQLKRFPKTSRTSYFVLE